MRRLPALVLVALVASCDGPVRAPRDGGAGGDAGEPAVAVSTVPGRLMPQLQASIAPSASTAPAFDPELPGFTSVELAFDAQNHAGLTCAITIAREGATLATLAGTITPSGCSASWDGRAAGGALVDPGPLEVTATLSGRGDPVTATSALEVLRLGVREIQLEGPGRAPLLYRALGGVRYGYYEVPVTAAPWRIGRDASEPAAATALELADGSPRALPAIWEDLESPPLDDSAADGAEHDSYNLPTAWVAGSVPAVRATLSTAWIGGVADPIDVDVRIVPPEGTSVGEDALVADGREVVLTPAASWVPAVGRYDVPLEWRFEARRPGGEWVAIPGSITTTHRLYGLVAPPIFDYASSPHRAWVDVLDRVTGWVDGAASDADAVASRIVEGVFYELGLQYDNQNGASHYTSYPGGWTGAIYDLSRFAELENGNIINCSDAASIVSTYANMVGIDLRYHIIQHRWDTGFDLNYLYAIGRSFAASPFTSGRASFRYHAITGPPDTRVFDATLALDGDGMPSSPPNTTLLVQGLTQHDYLVGLSPEWDQVNVFVDEKVRVR